MGILSMIFNPKPLIPEIFFRIVGHQPEFFNTKICQYFCTDPIISEISRKTKCFIGFHSIHPGILKVVGF